MLRMLKRFVKDERGLEASEYALLLALICIAIAAAVMGLRDQIARSFTRATTELTNTIPTP